MPIFKITITDEFNMNFVFETNDSSEVSKIVNEWLSNYDETPLYSILIDIQPN
jgi:hypothetical protein